MRARCVTIAGLRNLPFLLCYPRVKTEKTFITFAGSLVNTVCFRGRGGVVSSPRFQTATTGVQNVIISLYFVKCVLDTLVVPVFITRFPVNRKRMQITITSHYLYQQETVIKTRYAFWKTTVCVLGNRQDSQGPNTPLTVGQPYNNTATAFALVTQKVTAST